MQEIRQNPTSTFKASAYIMTPNIPLIKTNYMAMQDIGQRYTGTINYRNLVYDMSAFHIKRCWDSILLQRWREESGKIKWSTLPYIHTYIHTKTYSFDVFELFEFKTSFLDISPWNSFSSKLSNVLKSFPWQYI